MKVVKTRLIGLKAASRYIILQYDDTVLINVYLPCISESWAIINRTALPLCYTILPTSSSLILFLVAT